MNTPSSDNLSVLHDRLDAFFARVMAHHGEHMACASGCSGCCQQSLSVFAVEMDRILAAVDVMPGPARDRLRDRATAALAAGLPAEETPCVLLEEDRCTIYDARPSICRSHGAPVLLPRELGDGRDVCPLNFTSPALTLAAVPATDVLDLDRVNQTLAVINHLALAPGQAPRLDITATLAARLAEDGLNRS